MNIVPFFFPAYFFGYKIHDYMLLGLRDPETHSDLHLMTKCFMCYPPFSTLSGGTKKLFLIFIFASLPIYVTGWFLARVS